MTRIESLVKAAAEATDERVNLLHELFPEVITEGKIDFAKLRLVLGDDVEEDAERYSFTWAGKRAAVNRLQQHSRSSMVPDREKSINFETSENIFIEGENLEVGSTTGNRGRRIGRRLGCTFTPSHALRGARRGNTWQSRSRMVPPACSCGTRNDHTATEDAHPRFPVVLPRCLSAHSSTPSSGQGHMAPSR